MNIRKLVAATAIAGAFTVAGSGLAFADESQTAANLQPGARVCVEVPSTADPVRAEGLADRGVTFTLTAIADGSSAEQVLAQSAEPVEDYRVDANSFLNPTAFPGTVKFCAVNGSDEAAFVTLDLVSFESDGLGVAATNVAADATPGPVVVNDPADHVGIPATSPVDIQSVLSQIQELIDQLLGQLLGAVA